MTGVQTCALPIYVRGGTNIVFDNTMSGTVSGCNNTITIREEDDNDGTDYPIKTDYPGYDPVIDTYIWGNTLNGSDLCISESDAVMLEENRDYWDDYKDLNFTSDLAANRGSSCSDDDNYWETDTKKLYRCEGTNNWVFIYKPYTYPHPLTKIGPAAAKNLRITD